MDERQKVLWTYLYKYAVKKNWQKRLPDQFAEIAKLAAQAGVFTGTIPPQSPEACWCYLAFFGRDKATHLKVGISRDPSRRIRGFLTGNPMKPLWVYAMSFDSRREAARVESFVLKRESAWSAAGEWLELPSGRSEAEAQTLARDIERYVRDEFPFATSFIRQ